MDQLEMDRGQAALILDKLERIESLLQGLNSKDENQWIDNQEVCFILKASKRTIQYYRDSGKLAYSQPVVGGKVYYKLADVHRLLEDFYIRKKTC